MYLRGSYSLLLSIHSITCCLLFGSWLEGRESKQTGPKWDDVPLHMLNGKEAYLGRRAREEGKGGLVGGGGRRVREDVDNPNLEIFNCFENI